MVSVSVLHHQVSAQVYLQAAAWASGHLQTASTRSLIKLISGRYLSGIGNYPAITKPTMNHGDD